ncbi:MAG: putative zinc-binding protein [Thermacetogeniaceae bacterium]
MYEKNQGKVAVVTCPGGSNLSLLAYNAASDLEKQGYCRFVRLAGENLQEKNMQRLAEARENTTKWVLVEGCPQGCGKKILDSAGINPDRHFIVTSLGIERENRIDYTKEQLERVISAVKELLLD